MLFCKAHEGRLPDRGRRRPPVDTTKDKECEILSDYFRNQPNQQDSFQTGKAQGREDWPEMPVWQQSEMLNGLDDAGMTMQQGGVPLYGAGGDFLTEGDNAPTRIGKPISQQLLNRRAAPESGVEPALWLECVLRREALDAAEKGRRRTPRNLPAEHEESRNPARTCYIPGRGAVLLER